MVYMDTPYEERNLGVTSCKFTIQRKDNVQECLEQISRCTKQYQEAVVEAGNIEMIHGLENQGFRFMETMIDLEANRKELVIPRVAQRFLKDVAYEPSTKQEIDAAVAYIRNQVIFSTDKIALNPAFGPGVAGRRYSFWARDLLKEGADCYSFKYKGEVYGFEFVRLENGTARLCLGTGYVEKGAGTSLITSTASYKHWMESNIEKLATEVSSNNPSVLKLHEMYGLHVVQMRYILSKNL